ncbi:hypothetical protein MKZ38_001702 [Zalerion maritima]|uniref:Uncharacterized protein n=1 Tax=Zalerion maritima TaxID=339359 RepID=A0AAD5RRF5_9PEZI|nr:hypothetical protein MKZ38_001702 [Zalerion maritima]
MLCSSATLGLDEDGLSKETGRAAISTKIEAVGRACTGSSLLTFAQEKGASQEMLDSIEWTLKLGLMPKVAVQSTAAGEREIKAETSPKED